MIVLRNSYRLRLLPCLLLLAGCYYVVNDPGTLPTVDAGPVVPNGCAAQEDGGSVAFSAQVTGSIQTTAFTPMDGVMLPSEELSFGGPGDAALILTTYRGVCGRLVAGAAAPNGAAIFIELVSLDANGNSLPATIGTYTVGSDMSLTPSALNAVVAYESYDASCNSTAITTSSGTITVTAINLMCGGSMAGSFDIFFNSVDELKGTFTAPFCLGPVTQALNCVP